VKKEVKNVDYIDYKILKLLQEDSRMTIIQISKELHLSRPSINERLRRLQESGVIEGFTTRISPQAIGKSVQAIIQIGNLKCGCREFEEKIKSEQDILECHRVTGTDSYFMKTAVSSIHLLEDLVDKLIPYGQVTTSIILSSSISHRPLLPDIEEEELAKD
jgi:Lrp/AsnC family transcriptional regulator, leucine-responsive regulatory protein